MGIVAGHGRADIGSDVDQVVLYPGQQPHHIVGQSGTAVDRVPQESGRFLTFAVGSDAWVRLIGAGEVPQSGLTIVPGARVRQPCRGRCARTRILFFLVVHRHLRQATPASRYPQVEPGQYRFAGVDIAHRLRQGRKRVETSTAPARSAGIPVRVCPGGGASMSVRRMPYRRHLALALGGALVLSMQPAVAQASPGAELTVHYYSPSWHYQDAVTATSLSGTPGELTGTDSGGWGRAYTFSFPQVDADAYLG